MTRYGGCKGCGNGTDAPALGGAYCSDPCRQLHGLACLGTCLPCGGTYARERREAGSTLADFVGRHRPCRADALDHAQTADGCRCRLCSAQGAATTRPGTQAPPMPAGHGRRGREVLERDGHLCQICRLPTDPYAHPADDRFPTIEQVVLACDGGTDDAANLRTAHRWCSSALATSWSEGRVMARAQARFR